ncbi:MAG: hypothetical protein JOZ41_06600 [Chloroflexi bacterium]|nr:hypothetical protein [Chloroflexota bacterium]
MSGHVPMLPDAGRLDQLGALRTNAFAVLVMLLVEFSLGMWVNLEAKVPASDHGTNLALAIVRAILDGPVGLSLHALLGLLLVVGATAALIRAVRVGEARWTAPAGLGLASVILAALSGARFVGTAQDGASLAMALFAALAMLSYALILLRSTPTDTNHES